MIVKKELPHQSAFLQAPYLFPEKRFFFDICGYGAGKTSCLVDSVLKAVTFYSGKKDREGRNPKIGVCGISLTFLKKTLSGALVQVLVNTKSKFRYDKASNIIYIAGVEVFFIPIADESEIFGYDLVCAFVDEIDELPIYTCIGVVKALNDRCRQLCVASRPPFMAFTTTSQGLKGTYQTIMNFRKNKIGYVIVRGCTKDNIYLPKEYVKSMYEMYNDKERMCLLEGIFVSIDSGLVFPDYSPERNYLDGVDFYDRLEDGESVYIGQDFNSGWNKAVACVLRDNNVYAIKTYSFPDARSAPEVFRHDFPSQKIFWIPDMTYKEHFGDFAKGLRAYNIRIIYRKCNPNVVSRNFAINKMFHGARLFLCEITQDLSQALMLHEKDKKTGLPAKGQGEKAPDHYTDAFAYVISYLVGWKRELKDIFDITMGRDLRKHTEIGDAEDGYDVDTKKPANLVS